MDPAKSTLNLGNKQDFAVLSLLDGNRKFAKRVQADDPQFFERQAQSQKPSFLWIGCSDSRVASDVITDTDPGNLFVHRNIANLVVHTDMNVLCAIDYAVKHLGVQHIVVCGHYNCGGVLAAMDPTELGLIDNWLRNIKDVYRLHQEELDAIADRNERARRLVELNVVEQVYNVCKTSTVQKSWRKFGRPFVHGWVYDLETGYLKEIAKMTPGTPIEEIYMFDYGDRKTT